MHSVRHTSYSPVPPLYTPDPLRLIPPPFTLSHCSPTHVWAAYSVRGFSKHRIHSVSLTTSPIPPPSHTPTPTAVVSPPLLTRFTLSHTLPYLATCSVEDQAWLRATSLCTISLKLALLTQSPDLTQGRYMALLEGLTPPVPPHFPICIHIPPFLFPHFLLRHAFPSPPPHVHAHPI